MPSFHHGPGSQVDHQNISNPWQYVDYKPFLKNNAIFTEEKKTNMAINSRPRLPVHWHPFSIGEKNLPRDPTRLALRITGFLVCFFSEFAQLTFIQCHLKNPSALKILKGLWSAHHCPLKKKSPSIIRPYIPLFPEGGWF